jgi:hypothetical protein
VLLISVTREVWQRGSGSNLAVSEPSLLLQGWSSDALHEILDLA